MKNIIRSVIVLFLLVGCQKKVKKTQVELEISGMTCEIGCTRLIQSKLSKTEGVLNAKVVFSDSLAIVGFDKNKTSKKELIMFINGIADGDLYKVKE